MMNYFKNSNNTVFAYDDEQVKQGYGKDLTPLISGEYYNGQEIKPYRLNNTDEEVIREEDGVVTSPQGLVEQLATEAQTQIQAEVKSAILQAINTMRVEVDGIGYDGDEASQDRMNRAIQTLVGDETITWRVYDNTTVTITQTELGKALRASGIMMTRLWFSSSIEEVLEIVSEDAEWLAKYEAQ